MLARSILEFIAICCFIGLPPCIGKAPKTPPSPCNNVGAKQSTATNVAMVQVRLTEVVFFEHCVGQTD